MNAPSLDHAFLDYIGYDPERQKLHQRFYLSFFVGCKRVIDLGCGNGDFVELLVEQGIDALGVDADPIATQSMRERSIPVVQQDVLTYLKSLSAESIDGIFAGHLVEHMPYESVFELIQLGYQALKPGGVIVLTTPDPRSLYAHLETYYLHFGHSTFYHPRLLCFFLEHVGFVDATHGSNDSPAQSRFPLFGLADLQPVQARLPIWETGILRRILRIVRMGIAYVLLKPYLDIIRGNFRSLTVALQRLDRPFECYAKAVKPPSRSAAHRKEA